MAGDSTKKIGWVIVFLMLMLGVVWMVNPTFFSQQTSNQQRDYLLTIPAFENFEKIILNQPVFTNAEGKKQEQNLLSVKSMDLLPKGSKICPQTDTNYQKAAMLFHQHEWTKAKSAFTLLLKKDDHSPQQICVLYNLARIEKQFGHSNAAIRLFVRISAMVAKQGVSDPLHLGIASYGEVAGLLLDRIGQRQMTSNGKMNWIVGAYKDGANSLSFEGFEEDSLSTLEKALRLYVTQAVLGDKKAYDSIAVIMAGLMDPDNPNAQILFKKAMLNSDIRQIIFAYIFNQSDDVYHPNSVRMKQNILKIFQEIIDDNQNIQEDDRYIAIYAYQQGDIKLAKQLAKYDWIKYKHPISAWILAKIALREHHLDEAQDYYDEVEAHYKDFAGTISATIQDRMQKEIGVFKQLHKPTYNMNMPVL